MECSEILYSDIKFEERIDAEYYQKIYIKYENKILSCKNNKLHKMATFLVGPFGSAYNTSNYTDISNYRYVRGQDVKPFILKDTEPRYITKEDFDRLSKYALKPKDVLVSVVGTLGNACIVKDKDIPAIFSCKSTVIRTNTINPYYLTTYLNSKYGRHLLLRKERGAIQKGLNLDDIRLLDTPLFSECMQKKIGLLLIEVERKLDEAKLLYKEAENILNKELDFENYIENKENNCIKSLSESFGISGRLDAEYYQKKYDNLFSLLKNFNCKHLDEIVRIEKSIEPGSECYTSNGVPFIRISDISKYEIKEPDIKLPKSIFGNVNYLFPKKDTILLSKDGSIGIAYKVDKDENFITSGALLHLKIINTKNVNPDYLTLILNSKIVQLQAERDSGGSIIKHWKLSEINKVVIPILDINIQEEIAKKIKKSFYYRKQSEKLLDIAIKMVETAIEEGEENALKLFNALEFYKYESL